jgi:hypothetical protein
MAPREVLKDVQVLHIGGDLAGRQFAICIYILTFHMIMISISDKCNVHMNLNHILCKVSETTDHGQATGKLYHLRLRVKCTLFVIYKAGREPVIDFMICWVIIL